MEVAGDEPALLWAVGERAALADDEDVATRALDRYRVLVPDQADRALALLAKWETAPAEVAETAPAEVARIAVVRTCRTAGHRMAGSSPTSADGEEVDVGGRLR